MHRLRVQKIIFMSELSTYCNVMTLNKEQIGNSEWYFHYVPRKDRLSSTICSLPLTGNSSLKNENEAYTAFFVLILSESQGTDKESNSVHAERLSSHDFMLCAS